MGGGKARTRAPARNVGMTNQIAATHKLHSTKSTIGFQEAWRMASFSESEVASALSRAATKLGYSTLLPQQERVVRAFVQGRDVFVSLPTGSGKSLCYCLLPLLFDGSQRKSIVVVVSPLISLMKDQVRSIIDIIDYVTGIGNGARAPHHTNTNLPRHPRYASTKPNCMGLQVW